MGFIFILPIAAASAWILGTTLRKIFSERTGSERTKVLLKIFIVGVGLGIWLGFFIHYRPNANFQIYGFPIPLKFFQLKDGDWISSNPSLPIQIGTIIANFLFALAIPCLPLKISQFVQQIKAPESETHGGGEIPR
jgi:hypothetical protein